MPTAVLTDFIANVPSCSHSTSLPLVLEIFSRGQSDRLVVIDEQKCPIGLVRLQRLMPVLSPQASSQFGVATTASRLELEQSILALEPSLIEPVFTIPAQISVEQFRFHLRSRRQTETSFDWALVDASGKLLGLLDNSRLLQFLAVSPSVNSGKAVEGDTDLQNALQDSLVQLLEQLPWPLLLQTSTGEVIAQNLAWWQQFGALTQGLGREVETVLAPFCICVWPEQTGQQRWQFIKIPLHDLQLRTMQASPLQNLESSPLAPHLWLLLAHDVTEQQQLASELAAKNADLIQLNRLKDEFLACISHELKTPLTAVLGLSNLLKDQALGHLNERQVRYAHLIHQSGRHLMSVVNDILDLTRMETGQLELTLEPVQIRTVCDRAIQQVEAMHAGTKQSHRAEKLLEVFGSNRFSIEPGLEHLVADELRLRQMLVHLLSNAFKFTEAGGEIGLCVSRWEGWIAFTVWDTGIGIPEQQQHLIFQKFQQLENPLTRRFEGTGLGLVLTRALARLHGGDVSFLSKEGKGSQFTLLLPPSPPQKGVVGWGNGEMGEWGDGGMGRWGDGESYLLCHSSTQNSKLSTQNSKLKTHSNRLVLVVEAAPRYIEDLTQLTNLGYRVVIARLGTEALEKARRLQPGAIFLNPLLPLLSGWDVLTLLKSDAVTSQIPVIVTATRAEKEQALANRADGFLSLPVQQPELQQLLTCFCTTPLVQSDKSFSHIPTDTPLTILRLVNAQSLPLIPCSSPYNYQVLEADGLEQAEILARVWQPHVALLEPILEPHKYLKQLTEHSRLRNLPLVTLDTATTQAANQIPGLSVFPCLTQTQLTMDALLPVLQTAAGIRKNC